MGRKVLCWFLLGLAVGCPGIAWAGGVINSGETKCGTMGAPSFMDSYTFTGTAGEHVAIGFAESSGSTTYLKYIDLYPPTGTAREAFASGYNAYLDKQLQQSGEYTIVVSDSGLNDTYGYCVSFAQSSAGATIGSDQTLSGNMEPSSVKAYRFNGVAGEHVAIGFAESSGSTSYLKYIDLYPPNGAAREAFASGYNAYLDKQLQETGTYMIVFTDSGLNDSYGYSVSFARSSGTRRITPGEKLGGTIVPGSVQAYRFYGQAGEHVAIGLAESSGSTTYLKYINLYPPNGAAREAFASGYNAYLDKQLQETGIYMIVFTDSGLNDSYGYNVSLVRSSGPMNSPGNLNGALLTSGETRSGILRPGYLNAYLCYGEMGDRVIIGFAESSGSTTYLKYINLYPPNGAAREAFAAGYNTSLDHQLAESGLYMIVVTDSGLNDTYDYSLTLVKIPSTTRPGIYSPVPANGAIEVPLKSAFSWSAVAGATGYDLYLATDMAKPPTKVGVNLPANSMAFPSLSQETLYYWRVIAHTPGGDVAGPYNWFQSGLRDRTPSIVGPMQLLLLN